MAETEEFRIEVKVGYEVRMLKWMKLYFKGETAEKLERIRNELTKKGILRPMTTEEKEFVIGLIPEYKAKRGITPVEQMKRFYGEEAVKYLSEFEVV